MPALPFHPVLRLPLSPSYASRRFFLHALRMCDSIFLADEMDMYAGKPRHPFEFLRPEQQIVLLASLKGWLAGKPLDNREDPSQEAGALHWVLWEYRGLLSAIKQGDWPIKAEERMGARALRGCAREFGVDFPKVLFTEKMDVAWYGVVGAIARGMTRGIHPSPMRTVKAREFLPACRRLGPNMADWGRAALKVYWDAFRGTGGDYFHTWPLLPRSTKYKDVRIFFDGVEPSLDPLDPDKVVLTDCR